MTPPSKKPRTESPVSAEDNYHQVAPLSPEQKSDIEQKRLNAKLKLIERQTSGVVVNIGPSWLKALEAEFSKPYFQKVGRGRDLEGGCQLLCLELAEQSFVTGNLLSRGGRESIERVMGLTRLAWALLPITFVLKLDALFAI